MTNNVSVRIGLVGGKEVEGQFVSIGQRGSAALSQLDTAAVRTGGTSRVMGSAIQNSAYQIGDFAVQVAAGTSASRALAMQLPQLLGGFGVMGAVVGAVFAIMVPLVGSLFDASDATADLVREMTEAGGTASSVESAMSAVRDVAKSYAAAIRESGGASSSAASLVIANSRAEFEARKEVLAVEIELMRIRGAERAADASALQSQIDVSRSGMMTDIGELAGLRGQSREAQGMGSQLPASLAAGFSSVTNAPIINATFAQQQQNLLALRKLNALGTLDDMTLQKAEEAYATEFANLTVAAGSAGGGGRSGGGGGGGGRDRAPEEAVKQGLDAMLASLTEFSAQTQDIGASVGDALVSGFSRADDALAEFVRTGKFNFRDLVTSMVADMARLASQKFITGPLAGLLASSLSGMSGGFAAALSGALTSFDGGGYTGSGPRSGGLDGRGGFLAMMHPQEQVIDRARGQTGNVVMNIYARDAQSFHQSRGQIAADAARFLRLSGRMG
jgi:hypothetical protein